MSRRFKRLRARLLLLKQDKLSLLEKKLDDIDDSEECEVFLAKSRIDRNPERQAVLQDIEAGLADYGMPGPTIGMQSLNAARSICRENP